MVVERERVRDCEWVRIWRCCDRGVRRDLDGAGSLHVSRSRLLGQGGEQHSITSSSFSSSSVYQSSAHAPPLRAAAAAAAAAATTHLPWGNTRRCCCAARASLRSSLPLRWGWVGGWMGGVEQTSLSALLCSAVCPRKRSLVSLLSNYSTYKTCYRRTYFFSHTHAHKCRKRERKKETFRSIAHTTHVLIVHLLLLPLLRPTKAKVMGIWNNQDGNLAPIRLRQQPLLCTATA